MACTILLLLASSSMAAEQLPQNVSYPSVVALGSAAPDNTLTYGSSPHQFAEHWAARTTEPGGTVLLVHGGCWLNAFDLTHARPLASALADAGYEVWSLEYRRTGDSGGGWPGSLQDVIAGSQTVLSKNVRRPTVLIGHSAGGHLAIKAALHVDVDGVIGLAAITDVVRYAGGSNSCQQATSPFMGGTPDEQPEAYARATITRAPTNVDVHLLQGDADAIVPVWHAEVPGAARTILPGAGHFDWIHPHTEAFRTLLSTLKEFSEP